MAAREYNQMKIYLAGDIFEGNKDDLSETLEKALRRIAVCWIISSEVNLRVSINVSFN